MEKSDGSIRIKIDVDTSGEKEIGRSLENIQDDADNAKRKLDALKQTGVDENAKSFKEAAAELEKYNKELDEYLRKQKEATNSKVVKPIKVSDTGSFDSISDQVEDYETRLKMLRNKGYGPGDAHFDELYIAWKNAVNAEKEYLANLNKMTDKSIADEAKKQEEVARKLQEEAEEYERLNRIRAQAKVHDKDLVKLLEKQEAITARMAELKRAGVGEGYKEYDSLRRQLKSVNNSIDECRNGFKKAGESGKKTLSSLNKSTKKSSSLFGTMASRLKGLALSLLIFNWISKGFNAMVSAMKEGFRSLASYSKEYNGVMSEFKSSLAELKNNLAAAFEPIVNTVVPYLTKMVDGLNTAIETFSRFMAYMSGKSTYTRAKQQLIDYKNTVDSTNKSLAKFDKLTVMNNNSAGGEKTGADAFETVDIGEVPESFKQFKSIYETYVQPTLSKFKDALLWLGGQGLSTFRGIFSSASEAAGKLWNSIKNLYETAKPYITEAYENAKRLFLILFEGMYGIWDTIGRPIFGFIIQVLQDTIDYFSGHVGEMSDAFGNFVDGVEDSWNNYLLPALKAIGKFLEEILLPAFEAIFEDGILPLVGDVFLAIDNLIQESLLPAFNGICEFLEGVFTLDFEKALNGIKNVMRGIINGIITLVESGTNIVIDAINAMISGWNSIASKVNGPTIGLVGKVSLSKLQEDGSWSSFTRTNGNNTYNYNPNTGRTSGGHRASTEGQSVFYGSNPRYRSQAPTDWNSNNGLANTVKSGGAFGSNENNTYTFVAQLDGKTIFKEVVNQNDLEKNRSGYSPLTD